MEIQNLVVDESYIEAMKNYIGKRLNSALSTSSMEKQYMIYLSILKRAEQCALVSGNMADAFHAFESCAEQLRGAADAISTDLRHILSGYLIAIENADQYLFEG